MILKPNGELIHIKPWKCVMIFLVPCVVVVVCFLYSIREKKSIRAKCIECALFFSHVYLEVDFMCESILSVTHVVITLLKII